MAAQMENNLVFKNQDEEKIILNGLDIQPSDPHLWFSYKNMAAWVENSLMSNNHNNEENKPTVCMEIQPYVPQNTKGVYLQEDELNRLTKSLKKMVSKVVSDLKGAPQGQTEERIAQEALMVLPLSFYTPEDVIPSNYNGSGKRGRKITTSVVGEISVSFTPPENSIPSTIDMDKLLMPQMSTDQISRRFKFNERLEGWNIQRRQRVSGSYDLYYQHIDSRQHFRSINEVVNFLLYEICPNKPGKGKEGVFAENEETGSNTSQALSTRKRKLKDSNVISGKKKNLSVSSSKVDEQRKIVEEFLAESNENLMNCNWGRTSTSNGYDDALLEDYVMSSFDEDTDYDSISCDTVEMLEKMYDNFYDHFNDEVNKEEKEIEELVQGKESPIEVKDVSEGRQVIPQEQQKTIIAKFKGEKISNDQELQVSSVVDISMVRSDELEFVIKFRNKEEICSNMEQWRELNN